MFKFLKDYFSLAMGERFQEFDGLRAWAILMVFGVHLLGPYAAFQYHLDATNWLGLGFLRFLNAGHIGVDLFFVLSGFLIFHVLTSRSMGFVQFMKKRFRRLMPAHFFVIFLLILFFYKILQKSGVLDPVNLILNLFFLNQFVPYSVPLNFVSWSLSYELVFYVFLWCCVVLLRRLKVFDRLGVWLMIFLSFYSLQTFAPKYFGNPHQYLDLARGAAFFWGVLLGKVYFFEKKLWGFFQNIFAKCSGVAIVGILLLQYFWSFPGSATLLIDHREKLMIYYFALHVSITILVGAMLANQPQFLKKIFRAWPLRILGLMSYSFYLVHGVLAIPVSAYFLKWMPGGVFKILVHGFLAFTLALFLSALSYHFFERPYFLRKRQVLKKTT
jgi:exopolysaccharide production protein ExoZ